MHENREISSMPWSEDQGRSAKAINHNGRWGQRSLMSLRGAETARWCLESVGYRPFTITTSISAE
jgi:hypothetical protein